MGKVLFWGFWALVALWVIKHPEQASNDVHSVGAFFSTLAS